MSFSFLSKSDNGASTISNAGGITAGATSVSIQAGDTSLFPGSGNFVLTLWPAGQQPTKANAEKVLVTAGQGTQSFTITRGYDGSTAKPFSQNDNIALLTVRRWFDDIEAALSTLLGLFPSGAVVGTTDTQTLTNKSIDASEITSGTLATGRIPAITTSMLTDANVTSRKMKLDQLQTATSTTDMNTASTSYIDYTGLSLTFTPTVASNFLVFLSVNSYGDATTTAMNYVVALDGAIQGNDPLIHCEEPGGSVGNIVYTMSSFLWLTGVSATAHTVKVQLKKGGGGNIHTQYGSLMVIPFAS